MKVEKRFLVIASAFLTLGLAACNQQSSTNADNTGIAGTPIAPNELLQAQQFTICHGESVQNVHKGYYQEPANSGIYPVKAKGNMVCTPEFTNIAITGQISVYRLVGGSYQYAGGGTNSGVVGTNGLNLFLQANAPCINGTYFSRMTLVSSDGIVVNQNISNGDSAISTVTGC